MLTDPIYAGATLDLGRTLTAYPAPEWTLRLFMRGATAIDLTAVPDGSAHRFTVAANTTASWPPGVYWYSLRAQRAGEVVVVDEGQVSIRLDLAQVTGEHDGSTHAERVLAKIEAVIEGRATTDVLNYEINGRQLGRAQIEDLLLLRSKYRDEVRRERMAKRTGQSLFGRVIRARM